MLQRKSWALENPGGKKLLLEFPRDLRNKLIRCYFEDDTNSIEARQVLEYLSARSTTTRIIRDAPGSAAAFEYFYRMKRPEDPIDEFFVQSLSGYHVYLRLKSLEKHLPHWIRHFMTSEEKVLIDNVGSGPGHELVSVLAAHPEVAKSVHVRDIDSDEQALEVGREKVEVLGLGGSFSFVHGSFHKAKRRDATWCF